MGNWPETLDRARQEQPIQEAQRAVARELAAVCEVPKTIPARIADHCGASPQAAEALTGGMP
jgi:hypothetical protein